MSKVKVLDLSQNFSADSPSFAFYEGPTVKWVKRLAFEGVNAQFLSTTNHIATHLDSPIHFYDPGPDISGIPLDKLVGPACIVDLQQFGVGDYQIYGPEHFEQWEAKTGIKIERGDILVIHTGYHRYYPENWADRSKVDETKYFIRHPGPTRAFAEWVLKRGVRYLAVDVGSADHPMNTVIRRIRADEAEDAEKKLGRSLDDIFPRADYQIMHTLLFPHDIVHIENLGGQIDEVLDQKIQFGCFPWRFQGGEAALCRAIAMIE
jgi:kynurenine formamidase